MVTSSLRRRGLILSLLLVPSLAVAAQLPARFTLGNYVPEHAWFFVHHATNPDRAWIDQKWSEVFDALKKTGVDKDLMTLVMSAVNETDRAKAKDSIDKVTNLVRGVSWSDLAKQEFAFAEGLGSAKDGYGYLLLARGAEGSAQANFAGLSAILKALVETAPEKVKLQDSKSGDVDVVTLRAGAEKPGESGVAFDLFRKGDVIGVAFDAPFGGTGDPNRATFTAVMDLMSAKPTKSSILASKRFQEAMTLVPTPQDSVSFFDVKTFLGDLTMLFENVAKMAKKEIAGKPDATGIPPSPGKAGEQVDQGLAVARKVIGLFDFIDVSVTSVETKGRRELKHEATRLQPGKESSVIVTSCILRKPFEKFDQFIPADATGFDLSGSVDLGPLYQLALEFVTENVPEGKEIVSQVQSTLAAVGFDPQRDIFDWLSGEMVSIEMPAAVVTPMGGTDSLHMIRVKNPQLASQKINAAIDFLSAQMQAAGQTLMVSPASVNAEGFREVTHPIVAMFVRPVIGVHGEWLMIGSSAGAVNKCLDVSTGKTASVKENARYKSEGLVPTGPVLSASFKDTSNFGNEMSGGLGMVGMIGGMAMANIPEKDEGQKQAKKTIQSALGIVMKLGPVLQKIDFYSSESSTATYDGKLTTRKESVITYKEPKASQPTAPKAPSAPAAPETPKPPKP